MPDTFTPEQIAQILEEFFKVVGTRQYIGARYVPIFGRKDEESIEWDNTGEYEPLTIVLYQGNSYTSRQFVPVGVEITNQEFWAITGNYNAQVEMYRRETAAAREVADNALTAANNAQTDINTLLPKADFSEENTVKDYVDTSVAVVQADIDTLLPKADFSAENTVKDYVDASVATVQNDIDTLLPKADFSAENTVKDYVDTVKDYVDSENKINVKNSSIAPIRLYGRLLDAFGYNNTTQSMHAQSTCYKNGYYYTCGSYESNAKQSITVHSSTGEMTNSAQFTQLFHANSITADDSGRLIVASGDGLNLHVINAATLAYIGEVSFSSETIVNIFSICYDNGYVYIRCRDGQYNNYIYRADIDDNTFELVANLGMQKATVAQGFAYKDSIAYLLNNMRDTIYVYDCTNGNLLITYAIPDGDGYFPIGEPEDLFFKDNSLLFNAAVYYPVYITSNAAISYIFDCGICEPTEGAGTIQQASSTTVELSVNPSGTVAFCPTNNFTTIEEACVILSYLHGGEISISGNVGTICLTSGNYSLQFGANATAKEVYVYDSSITARRLNCDKLTIHKSAAYIYSMTISNTFDLFNANVTINDCSLLGVTVTSVLSSLIFNGSIVLDANTVVTKPTQQVFANSIKIDCINPTYAHKLLRLNGYNRAKLVMNVTAQFFGGNITVSGYQADTFTSNVSGGTGLITSVHVDANGKFVTQDDGDLSAAYITMEVV